MTASYVQISKLHTIYVVYKHQPPVSPLLPLPTYPASSKIPNPVQPSWRSMQFIHNIQVAWSEYPRTLRCIDDLQHGNLE